MTLYIPFEKYDIALLATSAARRKTVKKALLVRLFNQNVQQLYDYGMQFCSDRTAVINALMKLFSKLRDETELPVMDSVLRTKLFKLLRVHLIKKTKYCPREVAFLRLQNEFSYNEIADIMNLDIDSVRTLLFQQLKAASSLHEQYDRVEE